MRSTAVPEALSLPREQRGREDAAPWFRGDGRDSPRYVHAAADGAGPWNCLPKRSMGTDAGRVEYRSVVPDSTISPAYMMAILSV